MQKKRILLIGHSSLLAGGAEDEFERLLKHFYKSRDKFEIQALFPEGPRANTFARYCDRYEIYPHGFFPVTTTRFLDYIFFFKLYFKQKSRIKKFIKNENYDLCIINVVVLVWPVFFLKKISKKLVFIRETIEPKIFRKIIYKLLNRYVSYFITVSDINKEDYVKLTNNKNISVLYSAIEDNLEIDSPSDDEVNKFIHERNIEKILSKDRFKVVCVGALYDRKNQFLILESLKVLKEKNKTIPIVYFIGDTDADEKYFKKMKEYIQRESLDDYCFFLGTIEKKIYYKLITFFNGFIISSKSEGLPLVLAEALRFKIPLITTDSGGIKNIIINNYNGIFIKTDKYDLTNALIQIQDQEFSKKITVKGFETYKSKLNLTENFKKLDVICEKIINN